MALRFNGHPSRIRDDGLHHIAGPAVSVVRSAAFRDTRRQPLPGASLEVRSPSAFAGRAALLRIATSEAIPLQRSIARGDARSCGLPPTLASRSRDLVRRKHRRPAHCPWPPRWAANHRTAGSEARPGQAFRLTTLMGFTPFAVLILIAGPADVSIRRRPPAVDPNVHPGSAIFSNTGRSAAFPASGRSMAQPPARRICTEQPITNVQARLLGFRRHSSRAAQALAPVAAVLPWALPLAGLRTPAGVRAVSRNSQHAVSPGRRSSDAAMHPAASFRFRFLTLLSFGSRSFSRDARHNLMLPDLHLRCRRLFSVFRC